MPTLKSKPPVSAEPADTQLQIVYISRTNIKFWEDNPRRNDKAALEVAEIIRQNGMKSPINLWKKDYVVYKGNTSLKALDLLHKAGVKVKGIKYDGKEWFVPVILHEFASQEDANKYGLADNKAGEFSEWDDDLLANMMSNKKM